MAEPEVANPNGALCHVNSFGYVVYEIVGPRGMPASVLVLRAGGLADILLDGSPLQSETRLKSGVTLSCVPACEKASRCKHVAEFEADESCQ